TCRESPPDQRHLIRRCEAEKSDDRAGPRHVEMKISRWRRHCGADAIVCHGSHESSSGAAAKGSNYFACELSFLGRVLEESKGCETLPQSRRGHGDSSLADLCPKFDACVSENPVVCDRPPDRAPAARDRRR